MSNHAGPTWAHAMEPFEFDRAMVGEIARRFNEGAEGKMQDCQVAFSLCVFGAGRGIGWVELAQLATDEPEFFKGADIVGAAIHIFRPDDPDSPDIINGVLITGLLNNGKVKLKPRRPAEFDEIIDRAVGIAARLAKREG